MSIFNPTVFPDDITITFNAAGQLEVTGINALAVVLSQAPLPTLSAHQIMIWNSNMSGDLTFRTNDSTQDYLFQDYQANTVLHIDTSTKSVMTADNTLDDGSGNSASAGSISPGSLATAGTASHLFSGTGSPQGAVSGVAGDYYFNVSGNSATTHIYVCTGTTNWTGIA